MLHKVYKPIEEMTDDDLIEALGDFYWRIRNIYKVKNEQKEVVTFVPNDVQDQFLDDMWYRNVVPKARQRGFTTLMQILMLDYIMFEDNYACCLISENLDLAKRTLKNKLKFAYDLLPQLLKDMNPLVTDNKEELVWQNGSSIYVSTSPRGDTLQFLHVSELGKISLKHPEKANEISSGGFTAVDKTGIIVVESTVDSAAGLFPDMCREAMRHADSEKKLAQSEYKLHFASWWDADKYEIDPDTVVVSSVDHAYFERMEAEVGVKFNPAKRAWYVAKRASDYAGDDAKMKSQFPTTLEEAFEVSSEGLWLSKQMSVMRSTKRICDVPYDPSKPVNFFWDLGVDDDMAIWAHQEDGLYDNFINYFEGNNQPYAYFMNAIQKWGYEMWGTFWLPHDGNKRHQGSHSLKTPKDMLIDLGLTERQIDTVPRTPAKVVAIQELRAAMPMYRIDKEKCAQGIEHLDGYSKHWNNKIGIYEDRVEPNGHQHGADALMQHAQMRHDLKRLHQQRVHREQQRNRPRRTVKRRNAMTA